MKIVTKLLLGFLIIIIIAGSIGLFSIVQMNKNSAADTFLYEKSTLPLGFIITMEEAYGKIPSKATLAILQKDPSLLAEVDSSRLLFEKTLALYKATLINEAGLNLYNDLQKEWNDYMSYYDRLQPIIKAGKYEEAAALLNSNGLLRRDAVRERLNKMVEFKTESAKSTKVDNTRIQKDTTTAIYIFILFGIIASALTALWLTRTIMRGLSKVTLITQSIADGNLNNEIDISSRDEFGSLSSSIDSMQTSLRNSQNESLQSSQYARSLLEASVDPLVTISPDGKITDVNEATISVTGVLREKLIGTDFSSYFTEPLKANEGYLQVFEKGFVADYPLTIQHKNGKLTHVSYNASVYKDIDGKVTGVFAAARDITSQRQATQYARSLLEASVDPLVTISPDGKITDVNEATISVTGIAREKLINTDFSDYFTEPAKAREGYLQVFDKGFVKDYPLTIQHRSGFLTHVSYNASVYKDIEGKVTGVFAAARDVTEVKRAQDITNLQNWLKTGYGRLSDVMAGNNDISSFATGVITEVCKYLDAKIGALYILDRKGDRNEYRLTGSYAYTKRKNLSEVFKSGEGMIGQAAIEKQQILIRNVPDDYIRITSGLGEAIPKFICITPVIQDNEVSAVLEIGVLNELTNEQLEYLTDGTLSIGINLASIKSREALKSELERSKELAEELQRQQEELKASNEELEEQTQLLQQSEGRLQTQQEELRVANEELEEKNNSLQVQKKELTTTKEELEDQADELAIASKYKSEFLANMSHELRTPLNSLLILSKILSDNKKGNLTEDQVESAEVIYRSGNDLLSLINEILDLSKIEAGQMDVNIEKITISKMAERIRSDFNHIVGEKGLQFIVEINDSAPQQMESDSKRVEQIIKNLTSNAVKFTKKGSVTITFNKPSLEVNLFRSGLNPINSIAISVTDTGIGIAAEKQKIIFEAFQQADGGTAREYGGTGLGLSISRELAAMLGGEIQLRSEPGKGSEFTIYLPIKFEGPKSGIIYKSQADNNNILKESVSRKPSKQSAETVSDDRELLSGAKSRLNSILIIEDDSVFAKLLSDQCHEKGFKVLVALTGEDGIKLATDYIPAAIILDLHLPGMSGWDVLEIVKERPSTRHIPVHIMSVDDPTLEAFKKGAMGYLIKPAKKEELDGAFNKIQEVIDRPIKDLLVIEDNKDAGEAIVKLIGNGDVHSTSVRTGKGAIKELKSKKYDCIILDLGLPDMTGFELLEKLEEDGMEIPPVIVYTGKDLSQAEEMQLRKYAESIIIKGVKSEERLLDETSLFLHRMVEKFPEQKKKMILDLHDSETVFRDKKVLVVDDDMRNVFALSKVLSDKGLKILKAEDGIKALEILEKEPDTDLVIMDIMMPEMDGYETIRRIRGQKKFANLPIIALTAKAMKKDYEECIAAGANDYMSKPVDASRLISMLRIWLYR